MTLAKFVLMGAALALASLADEAGAAAPAGNTVLLKPVSIVIASGDPGKTLATGHTTIDTESIYCPSGYGCVLGLNIMSAVGSATCTNEWSINGLVDGNSVDGGPLVDALPGSDKTQTRNWQGSYSVAFGNHTVVFQIYVPCPATAEQWSVSYLVAKP